MGLKLLIIGSVVSVLIVVVGILSVTQSDKLIHSFVTSVSLWMFFDKLKKIFKLLKFIKVHKIGAF